ncbi:MAG: TIGR02466 family protein [Gammaproteobacteria bacterium]
MAAGKQDQPEITQLWPTPMLRHRLPGADRANPILLELVTGMERERPDLTTEYLAGNLFKHDHPALAWLQSCVKRAVLDYARAAGIDYELDFHIQAWANINRFGDYHNLHNHPHSWLSGTYYLQVPEPKPLPGRSDRNPGAISFYDPRPQANMMAVRGDPQVDPEHRILPRAGEILLWPAFLHHLVHPNLSDELRVSISFNIVLRWRNAYLP